MYDESEKPHALVCTEIWGGNRKVIRTIRLPSLVAWVASAPFEEGEGGGDLHYMSVCDHDLISRVALADGERPVSPGDLLATLYQTLGIPLDTHYKDASGRPVSIVGAGKPIPELL